MNDLQWWWLIAALTIVLNTIPMFMPPTWVLLTYFHAREGFEIWQLALVGAIAAATGRAILALTFRAIGLRVLPRRWQSNIEEFGDQLEQHRNLSLSAFALFMLGPLPSNQLFIAIGIGRMPLFVPLIIFAVSRFAGYVIWIATASVVTTSLADIVKPSLGGTVSIGGQIAGLVIMVAIMQIDWSRIFRERRAKQSTPTSPDSVSSN